MFRRKPTVKHSHYFEWVTEPEGTTWMVFARCQGCGHEGWACTARTDHELNDELGRAFRSGDLSALGYYTAPVMVPEFAA